MIRVRTASRLHFGLLSFPSGPCWPNWQGEEVVPARRFGGVGLMVQEPGAMLTLRPAAAWSAEGPLAERALEFARKFAGTVPAGLLQPQHLVIEQAAPEHVGLGSGTQLALAVAQALTVAWALEPLAATDMAQRLGRGKRSLLGTHGFAQGGFLVEGGRGRPDIPGPLLARVSFPDLWRAVLMIPTQAAGMHGDAETRAFDLLNGADTPLALTEGLCRLTLLGMLPALVERDLKAFAEALHDFNARAGQVFASVQGGTYSSQRVAELVAWLRRQGIKGAGQSSWGPTVFALVEDEDRALHLAGRVHDRFGFNLGEVLVTAACNHGAILETALD